MSNQPGGRGQLFHIKEPRLRRQAGRIKSAEWQQQRIHSTLFTTLIDRRLTRSQSRVPSPTALHGSADNADIVAAYLLQVAS